MANETAPIAGSSSAINRNNVLLVILPIILVLVGLAFYAQISPVYSFSGPGGLDRDPAYVYFFSGLTILEGNQPGHVDHPGTPLQVLIAICFLVQWFVFRMAGSGNGTLINSVLADPELYIRTVSWVLLFLNAWAVHYFGRRIFKATKSMIMAIFCQTSPLAFWAVSARIVYLSPEALLIFTSLCLLGLLAPILVGETKMSDIELGKMAVWAGIICGIGMVVKINFFPMLGMLLLLGRRKQVMLSLKVTVLTALVCLFPITKSLPHVANWIRSLIVHSGKYGGGEATVMNLGAMPGRMNHLFESYTFFYLVVLGLALVLILSTPYKRLFSAMGFFSLERHGAAGARKFIDLISLVQESRLKVPLVLVMVGIFQTLLVLKHYENYYLIPVLPVTFVGAVWLVRRISGVKFFAELEQWMPTALLVLACILVTRASSTAYNTLRTSRQTNDKALGAIQIEMAKYKNPLVIGGSWCNLLEGALAFGVVYARELDDKVAPFSPDFVMFHEGAKKVYVYGEGWIDLSWVEKLMSRGRKVLVVSRIVPALSAFNLEPLVHTPIQSLYEVRAISRGD